ncbi:tyrosine-type recombinase/integrase [Geomonas paludis]|uniref:Tyrosine-type recombinase/integrase n=1 Tax=Geomonas paludis TaxID=2740185 RepID=A0ABY4LI19_9BACT|nr:tyrosine-type recombinase/integrase [Geomonas paludis]UPU37512.1 tyrosine-type recombinase/integrase [Geomonas paludis]
MARNKDVKRTSIKISSSSGDSAGCLVVKPGSGRLYVDFYRGTLRSEISTGLSDSAKNRRQASAKLTTVLDAIERGTFCFEEVFSEASLKLKTAHARLDHRSYAPPPDTITLKEYVDGAKGGKAGWRERILANYPSESKQIDYNQALDDRILTHFGAMNFREINGVALEVFVNTLTWRTTKRVGKPLSSSRKRNILTVLNAVLQAARVEYDWKIPDPFDYLEAKKNAVPKRVKRYPAVFRYGTWQALLAAMPLFYRPIAELFLLTGMIGSEVAGLRKKDIVGGFLNVCNGRVKEREKEKLKNEFRPRRIPITDALRRVLDVLVGRSTSDYVVEMHDGELYSHIRFKDNVWESAFKKAGIPYTRPYDIRHTYAAWSMTLRMDLNKLERLMGHNSKQMLYETYGKYVQGLEEDVEKILEYMGPDFLRADRKGRVSGPCSEIVSENGWSAYFVGGLTI